MEIEKKSLNPFEFLGRAAAGSWSDPVEGFHGNALTDFCGSKKNFEDNLIYFVANGHIWIRKEEDIQNDSGALFSYAHAYGADIKRAMQIVLEAIDVSVEALVAEKEELSRFYRWCSSTSNWKAHWEAWDYVPRPFCADFEEIFLGIR